MAAALTALAWLASCADPTPAAVEGSDAVTGDADPQDLPGPSDLLGDSLAERDGAGPDGMPVEVADSGDDDVVQAPDLWSGDGPPMMTLTINEVPANLNGSQPYLRHGESHDFLLHVNAENFTLDVLLDRRGGPGWRETLSVTCDKAVTLPDGRERPPLTELRDAFDVWRIHFQDNTGLQRGTVVSCTGSIQGPGGASESEVTFVAAELPAALDPFPSTDTWLVLTELDRFDMAIVEGEDGRPTLESTYSEEGNGVPDLDEPFVAVGLWSLDVPEAAARIRSQLLEQIRLISYKIFELTEAGERHGDSVPIQLVFEGDLGAPTHAEYSAAGPFSMIALGGDGTAEQQEARLVGRAALDPHNQLSNNNAIYGRGVFITNLVRLVLEQPIIDLLLADIAPGRGSPFGTHPADAEMLAEAFDPALGSAAAVERYDLLNLLLDALARAVSSILCHEIGHSLGLVPAGAPPQGLFAGMDDLSFVDNYVPGAHIDTAGLNVMQTGAVTDYTKALSQFPRFNALNMGYLRRRIVVTGGN